MENELSFMRKVTVTVRIFVCEIELFRIESEIELVNFYSEALPGDSNSPPSEEFLLTPVVAMVYTGHSPRGKNKEFFPRERKRLCPSHMQPTRTKSSLMESTT